MKKTAFIFMASGFGSRFGSNKLLASFKGRPLYCHGLECILEASWRLQKEDGIQVRVIVVSQYWEILEDAGRRGAEPVYNGFSGEGITASLRLGAMAAAEDTDLYLFSVADQPYMKQETIMGLVREGLKGGKGIGCVCWGGKRGNPAVFASRYRQELLELKGDRGGSVIMKNHPEELWTMEVSEDEMKDIDVREDLNRAESCVLGAEALDPKAAYGKGETDNERG